MSRIDNLSKNTAHCGAKTRNGCPCKGPAMANGRCRMHGGVVVRNFKNRNAVIHGRRRARLIAEKRLMREMIAHSREVLRTVRAARRAEMAAARNAMTNAAGAYGSTLKR